MNERERDEPEFGGADEVTRMLAELHDVDPPADLAGTVMSRISSQAPARADRVEPVQLSGGRIMAKKVLWSVMGAAAAVLIVLKMAGYPPTGEGTEGTVGAAKRYQSQQIADQDVKTTDAELQAFMQSDAFHALMNDKAAREALSNADVQKALAEPAIRNLLVNEQVRHALLNDQVRLLLTSDALAQALKVNGIRTLLASPAFMVALKVPGVVDALARPSLVGAMMSPGFAAAVKAPAFVAALSADAKAGVAAK